MSRPQFLRQLGAALVDRVRRNERHEDVLADLTPPVPTGVDLYFVRRGARDALGRGRPQLEARVFRLLNSVE